MCNPGIFRLPRHVLMAGRSFNPGIFRLPTMFYREIFQSRDVPASTPCVNGREIFQSRDIPASTPCSNRQGDLSIAGYLRASIRRMNRERSPGTCCRDPRYTPHGPSPRIISLIAAPAGTMGKTLSSRSIRKSIRNGPSVSVAVRIACFTSSQDSTCNPGIP
jgi:hypothetical protein